MAPENLAETLDLPTPRSRFTLWLPLALVAALAVGGWCGYRAFASAGDSLSPNDSIEARRARVASLTEAEKEELARKQVRFESLSPEEQNQLRTLHTALENDPNGARLRQVLERYHDWLKTLSTGQRAELLDMPPDERLARITQLRQAEESQEFSRLIDEPLPPQDVRRVFEWVHQHIRENQESIIARLPEDAASRIRANPERQLRMLQFYLMRHPEVEPMTSFDPDRFRALVSTLSPETQEALGSVATEQQAPMLKQWVRATLASRAAPDRATPEELEAFFDRLPQERRERLESLPSDQMQQELRRLYYQERFGFRHGNGERGHWRDRDDHRRPEDRDHWPGPPPPEGGPPPGPPRDGGPEGPPPGPPPEGHRPRRPPPEEGRPPQEPPSLEATGDAP